MIVVKRMHVINWMYYGIQTVDFEMSNLLTGITGSGKSSLIDAMQVVLLGESGRGFNKSASGGRSDRSLLTYLRGKYHEKEFKRPDKAFSSYLAMDFYDEAKCSNFSYGVMFDIAEDNTIDKDFFYIEEKFKDNWALKSIAGGRQAARSRAEFKKYMKDEGISVRLFTPTEYKGHLLSRLGVYDPHFFQTFRTAVAYVPLTQIEDFIVTNICHIKEDMDVEKMKAAITEYQKMQREMEDFQQRQKELKNLNDIYEQYNTAQERYTIQDYIVLRSHRDMLQDNELAETKKRDELVAEQEKMEQEDALLKKKADDLFKRCMDLERIISEDPATARRKELDSRLKECESQIQAIQAQREKQLNRLRQQSSAWDRRLSETLDSPAGQELDRKELRSLQENLSGYTQYREEQFSTLEIGHLQKTNERLVVQRNQILSTQYEWKQERRDCQTILTEYKNQLSELEKGVKAYPSDLLDLRSYMQEQLSKAFEEEIKVDILADLLNIDDPVWANVIEGYLRRQKFDLLTDPKCYRKAVNILRDYAKQNRCYQYRVVNTGSVLQESMEVKPNSLATIISTHHEAARKYADYLLGRVEMVPDISSVTGRRTAVTSDGMLYHAFATARMNESSWRMHYIGEDSIAQQIAEMKILIQERESQVAALNEKIRPLDSWEGERTFSDEFLEELALAVQNAGELPKLDSEVEEIWAQLETIDDSYVKKLEEEKQQALQEHEETNNKRRMISEKKSEAKVHQQVLQQQIDENKAQWEEENAQFEQKYSGQESFLGKAELRYDSEMEKRGSAEKIYGAIEPAKRATGSRLETVGNNFREQAELYNRRHTNAVISTDISSQEWESVYNEMKDIHLEDYQEPVNMARSRAEEIFYNEFINHLKNNFDTVQREIKQLNMALEEYTFGKVRYRFKCGPTENAEMRRYYDMITSTRLDGVSIFDLIDNGNSTFTEYEPLVKTLFQLITAKATNLKEQQQLDANIEKYKSFRTYLHFDLVEVGPDGQEYQLSHTMGSKSGGERQTPFYVAILASLMKIYHINQNANSLRLVVFDEAFDKIDTSRIDVCINMLQEIGFQFLIAAPDHKSPYIAPLVENTLVVNKPDDKTSVILPYEKMA